MSRLVKFREWTCVVEVHRYELNDSVALRLVAAYDDPEDELFRGESIAMATICLRGYTPRPGYVVIKDREENTGMLAALQEAGVVGPLFLYVQDGYGTSYPVVPLIEDM